jgi:hypothetical protein
MNRFRALLLFVLTSSIIFINGLPKAAGNSSGGTRTVPIAMFALAVPGEWQPFAGNELATFRREYETQSKAIYQQYAKSTDPTGSVDLAAFHITANGGVFVAVSFTTPPQSNLIAQLKNEADQKGAWGVRQGYIKTYVGTETIQTSDYSGFYTTAIGNDGSTQISAGIEHKAIKNRIVQITMLCPKAWDSKRCIDGSKEIIKSFHAT